jgi:hypothetical protein
LKEAIMMRNRSDAYHRKSKKSAAYKLDGKCESLCADALEILQEIVAADASLQIWFDRNLDFKHGSLIDASLGNLPRLVTSRSIEKLSNDSRLVKKIKVEVAKRWWTASVDGKINLVVRYGSKPLEFAKGKNAIELASEAAVADTLRKLREAAVLGELDALIEQQAQFGRRLTLKNKRTEECV